MAEKLTRAHDFSLDVQRFAQTKRFNELVQTQGHKYATAVAIKETLKNFPDAKVGKDIVFSDGSRAILTTAGFRVE